MKIPCSAAFLVGTLLLSLPLHAAAPEKVKTSSVLVMDLQSESAEGVDLKLITEIVANEIAKRKSLNVMTSQDVSSAMSLEAQKQAAGCDDQSCLAEIAGALGADYVVFGKAGKLGDLFVVSLSVFDSAKARSAGRSQIEARDMAELPDKIGVAVDDMVKDFAGVKDAEAEPPGSGGSSLSRALLIGGGSALVLGAAGTGIFYFLASQNETELGDAQNDLKDDTLFQGRLFVGMAAASGVVAMTGLGLGIYGVVE